MTQALPIRPPALVSQSRVNYMKKKQERGGSQFKGPEEQEYNCCWRGQEFVFGVGSYQLWGLALTKVAVMSSPNNSCPVLGHSSAV